MSTKTIGQYDKEIKELEEKIKNNQLTLKTSTSSQQAQSIQNSISGDIKKLNKLREEEIKVLQDRVEKNEKTLKTAPSSQQAKSIQSTIDSDNKKIDKLKKDIELSNSQMQSKTQSSQTQKPPTAKTSESSQTQKPPTAKTSESSQSQKPQASQTKNSDLAEINRLAGEMDDLKERIQQHEQRLKDPSLPATEVDKANKTIENYKKQYNKKADEQGKIIDQRIAKHDQLKAIMPRMTAAERQAVERQIENDKALKEANNRRKKEFSSQEATKSTGTQQNTKTNTTSTQTQQNNTSASLLHQVNDLGNKMDTIKERIEKNEAILKDPKTPQAQAKSVQQTIDNDKKEYINLANQQSDVITQIEKQHPSQSDILKMPPKMKAKAEKQLANDKALRAGNDRRKAEYSNNQPSQQKTNTQTQQTKVAEETPEIKRELDVLQNNGLIGTENKEMRQKLVEYYTQHPADLKAKDLGANATEEQIRAQARSEYNKLSGLGLLNKGCENDYVKAQCYEGKYAVQYFKYMNQGEKETCAIKLHQQGNTEDLKAIQQISPYTNPNSTWELAAAYIDYPEQAEHFRPIQAGKQAINEVWNVVKEPFQAAAISGSVNYSTTGNWKSAATSAFTSFTITALNKVVAEANKQKDNLVEALKKHDINEEEYDTAMRAVIGDDYDKLSLDEIEVLLDYMAKNTDENTSHDEYVKQIQMKKAELHNSKDTSNNTKFKEQQLEH